MALPLWKREYHSFRLWQLDETWERLHMAMRERVRRHLGRDAQPSVGIIDSQTIKTTGVGGQRGYDSGKKIRGRKCHLLVDTQGLVLKAKVHQADITDRVGVILLADGVPELFPRLRHI